MKRTLGRSGIEVSALGMGCWGISGVYRRRDGGGVSGWGPVDDDESVRSIHRAIDLGVSFFDTADVYGTGHSERVLGRALRGRRDRVVLATKFGRVFDEEKREIVGDDPSPEHVYGACEASLKRLDTDRIDLYQFHIGNAELSAAQAVRDVLERLVEAGKIRFYGWSTDDPERARLFADGTHCTAIQQHLNVFGGNEATLKVCEQHNLASINRGPLAQGILTGKFTPESKLPGNDLRRNWDFQQGPQAQLLKQLDAIRDVLTSDGRTPTQGALCWLWARSERTIPIPGFKTVKQVEENAGAMRFGPLSKAQMAEIDRLLGEVAA